MSSFARIFKDIYFIFPRIGSVNGCNQTFATFNNSILANCIRNKKQGHCRGRMLIDKNVPNYLVKVKISSQRRRLESEKKREEASFTFIAAKLFLERFVWEKESSNFPSRWSRLELALKDRTPASPHQFCLENKLSCGCRDIKHLAPRSEDGFLIAFAQLSKWFQSCDQETISDNI